MKQLNYGHLHYFWVVARLGGVNAAARELRVSPPAISAQIRMLESSLQRDLFTRGGRRLTLTRAGEVALRYAEEIFGIGADLQRAMAAAEPTAHARLSVGVTDAVPKLLAVDLLAPVRKAYPGTTIVFREWRMDQLISELAMRRLDVVISDAPERTIAKRETLAYEVASSDVVMCASPKLAKSLSGPFPRSLDGAPAVLPTDNVALREQIDKWCLANRVKLKVMIEAEDRALSHHYGADGAGVLPVAKSVVRQICSQFKLVPVGVLSGVRETYYAIVMPKGVAHPAVRAMCERSGAKMVAGGDSADADAVEQLDLPRR